MREHSDQEFNFKIVLNIGQADEQEGVATQFKITNDYTLHYYEVSLQLRTTNLKITQRMTNNFTLRISNHHASGSRMDSINWLIQEFVWWNGMKLKRFKIIFLRNFKLKMLEIL